MKKKVSYGPIFWLVLALLALFLQSCPVWMGGFGMIFSTMTTVPIIVSAFVNPAGSMIVVLVVTMLLMLISPHEASIFLFMTASLGLAVGSGKHYKKGPFFNSVLGGAILLLGMLLCLYGIDIPIVGNKISAMPAYAAIPILAVFALAYAWLWTQILDWMDRHVMVFIASLKK